MQKNNQQKNQSKGKIVAREWLEPTGKQIEFLLRLGLPEENLRYIDNRKTAAEVIDELLAQE